MSIALTKMSDGEAGRATLVDFLTANEFPFHAQSTSAPVSADRFFASDVRSFWLIHSDIGRIGLVRLEDLDEDIPLFDLRLAETFRGRGLGAEALQAVTDLVFTTMPVDRFEGQTREDNRAMRAIFTRAGWTKEAHYRRSWPVADAEPRASVAYAILREEWESGKVGTVHFADDSHFAPITEEGFLFESNEFPDRTELVRLYDSVGWSAYTDDIDGLIRGVASSTHIVTARCQDRLVGLARVLSDTTTVVYLQDVLVDPEFHRRGIGRRLVELVIGPFAGVRQKVLLTDDGPEQKTFYESLGFSEAAEAGRWPVRGFVRLES